MKTLNEQIERVRELVRRCYGAVAGKNGTVPEVGERNMENLPAAIGNIKIPIIKPLNLTKAFYPNNYYGNSINSPRTENIREELGLDAYDLSLAKNFDEAFAGYLEFSSNMPDVPQHLVLDLTGLNAKPTTAIRLLQGVNLPYDIRRSILIDLSDWDTSELIDAINAFSRININNTGYVYIDIKGWKAGSLKSGNIFGAYANFNSLVGMTSLEDVVKDDVKILEGLKISIIINYYTFTNLNAASLRALINGLADVTDQPAETRPTLTIGALMEKLTDADIAIANNKGWDVA